MKQEEFIEGNKLIADFMGVKIDERYNAGYSVLYMKYNSSWDWLMPVVEKIESLNEFIVKINLNSCFIHKFENSRNYISKIHGKSKIEAVWLACIEFIKWYNENKK